MHGHEAVPPRLVELGEAASLLAAALVLFTVIFMTGLLPVPIGYERGKIRWVIWCGTGMHAHVVYLGDRGFQSLHPADQTEGSVR